MCAGRATHQPTSNRGENLACRNKSVDSRRQQNTAVCSKNKSPTRPGTGVGDGPTRRQQQHRLYEVRIESFRWLSFELLGAAKRALLAVSLASGVLWRLLWRGGNERVI